MKLCRTKKEIKKIIKFIYLSNEYFELRKLIQKILTNESGIKAIRWAEQTGQIRRSAGSTIRHLRRI